MPVILKKQRSGGLWFKVNPGKQFERSYLKNNFQKKGLVEWLNVKVLSSSPSTAKKQKQ
jgi:hypothetical protein